MRVVAVRAVVFPQGRMPVGPFAPLSMTRPALAPGKGAQKSGSIGGVGIVALGAGALQLAGSVKPVLFVLVAGDAQPVPIGDQQVLPRCGMGIMACQTLPPGDRGMPGAAARGGVLVTGEAQFGRSLPELAGGTGEMEFVADGAVLLLDGLVEEPVGEKGFVPVFGAGGRNRGQKEADKDGPDENP